MEHWRVSFGGYFMLFRSLSTRKGDDPDPEHPLLPLAVAEDDLAGDVGAAH